MVNPWLWLGFHIAVIGMLALDLGLAGRRSHTPRHAAVWSGVWVAIALAFGLLVRLRMGTDAGAEYYTAYLLEKSLSVDNLFVFVLIFGALGIAPEHRHRILFWGVLGALVMRGAMVFAGAALIARFEWVLYLFGAFLVLTGWRMWLDAGPREPHVGRALERLRRLLPIDEHDRSDRFLVRRPGRRRAFAATPLLVALLLIEVADLAFAVDSIPAVFAVTRDPFIVYTSNVMAVLGLRALFFLVADGLGRLRYLRHGLAAILVLIGAKMMVADWWHAPAFLSLFAILSILAAAIAASLLRPDASESAVRDAPRTTTPDEGAPSPGSMADEGALARDGRRPPGRVSEILSPLVTWRTRRSTPRQAPTRGRVLSTYAPRMRLRRPIVRRRIRRNA